MICWTAHRLPSGSAKNVNRPHENSLDLARLDAVRYGDNPRHRRARLVVPSDAGRNALRRIQAEQRLWADAIGSRIGSRDLERLNALLDRVAGAVDAAAAARIRAAGRA